MTTTTARPTGAGASSAGAEATPSGAYSHRQILTIISGLMLGMFLASLDQTVVSTAIRTISDDLHGYSQQAWATTAFLVTSTIVTPLYGKLSDIFGRKPFYLTAIAIFVVGSMLCGLAQSMYELAAFRAFQGLGAGGLMSLAFAIVGDIVPPRQRSRYQAYFMSVFASSSVLGPVIGGLLAGQSTILFASGWRWIFYVNVPIGVAAFWVVFRNLHLPHTRRNPRIDWWGAILLALTLVPLLVIAEQGREWGWSSTRAILCYAIGAIGLAAFLVVEHLYQDDALLPLRLFKNRTFAVGVSASAIIGIGMFGGLALLPQYLQVVKGSSPTVAGLQLIPLVAGIMLASIVSGRIISRTGRYRVLPIIGTSFMVVAMVLFSRVGADTPIIATMGVMLLFGAGLGMNMQPIILAVQNSVSSREIGVATSSVTFFRQIGGTLGTAVFLSVLFSTLGGKITTAVTAAAKTPTYRAALAAHPDQAASLKSGASQALSDTSFITRLDTALAHPFKVGFSNSMDLIFIIAAAVLLVGFLITWFLPELPLRATSALEATAAEDAQAASESEAESAALSAPAAIDPIDDTVDDGADGTDGTDGTDGIENLPTLPEGTPEPPAHRPHPAHRA